MPTRITIIKFVFLALFVVIVLRLGFWQIVRAGDLKSQAADQQFKSQNLPHDRGHIFYADGYPLATNVTQHLLYVDPHLFKLTFAQGKALSDLLGSSISGQLSQVDRSDSSWFPLASGLSDELRAAIVDLKLPGTGFSSLPARSYPEGTMSAQLAGFTGKDALGNPKGYFGLEGFYDRELTGKDGLLQQEQDGHNQPIVIGQQNYIPPQNGRDLITSIDRTIQFISYRELAAGIIKYQAQSGTVTVMEPQTGRILAMTSIPGYDPAFYQNYDQALFKNPIITESYEPGSTFKTVVMSAALDAGAVTPLTTCPCSSALNISGYPVKTWNDQYHPHSTMSEIIQNSDNVGMVFVASQLGHAKLLDYIKKFGFGRDTGVDLEEESSPKLRPDTAWTQIDYATAAFGQGIAVTPLQMVRAVSAIANHGKLVIPRVVDKITSTSYSKSPPQLSAIQVISPQAASQMTSMMVDSVQYNKVGWDWPKEFMIAGKTGTAQVPIAGHYDAQKTIGSFIGFAPADKPKFVMLVTLSETKTSPWGSRTAAPVWFTIAREILRYYQVSPM